MFNPRRYKEGASLSFTPEDTRKSQCVFHRGRSQCVSPWKVQGRSQFVFHPGGWGWPAIEDGWVGQQWEHSTCLGVIGV